MKRLITVTCLLLLVFCSAPLFAADLHKVQLGGVVPFSIGVEFPQSFEKGAFQFELLAKDEIGSLTYAVIVAHSKSDDNYKALLLAVSLDEGKTIHIVATMTGSVKGGQPLGLQAYRDESFFGNGRFSGILMKCPDFPTPEALERVAPPGMPHLI